MCFGYEHVETRPNCSHELITILKYHMPLRRSFQIGEIPSQGQLHNKGNGRVRISNSNFSEKKSNCEYRKYIFNDMFTFGPLNCVNISFTYRLQCLDLWFRRKFRITFFTDNQAFLSSLFKYSSNSESCISSRI